MSNITPDPTNPFHHPELVPQIHPFSLLEPTNPLFQTRKFRLPCHNSTQINALLSHLITASLPLFHTLLTRPPRTQTLPSSGRIIAHFPEPLSSLTPLQSSQTLSQLTTVLTLVNVIIAPTLENASGMTTPQFSRLYPTFPGTGSIITINPTLLTRINTAFQQKNHLLAQQIHSFELASLLLHEISHAVVTAVLPIGWGGNAFLGDSRTDEIGFEIEARLFGGMFSSKEAGAMWFGQEERFEGMLVQREWPHPHTVDSYRSVGGVDDILVRGGEVGRVCRVWKVGFEWVSRMFWEGFWEGVEGNAWAKDVLHVNREMGILVVALRAEDFGGRVLFRYFHPDEEGAAEWVPREYVLERNGLFRRADLRG